MKRLRLDQLPLGGAHIFSAIVPHQSIARGALRLRPPGFVAHPDEPVHVHAFAELFVILQGAARLRLDAREVALGAGDVAVVAPGENHHLEIGPGGPAVYLFLQFGGDRDQQ